MQRLGLIFSILVLCCGLTQIRPALADTRAANDADNDGYPDVLELRGGDRAAFNEWFARIAESQFYGLSNDWALEDQDCSGLLRYAFKNALMPHDATWRAKFKFLPRGKIGEVNAYSWPVPLIRRSVFRVAGGKFDRGPSGRTHRCEIPGELFERVCQQRLAASATWRPGVFFATQPRLVPFDGLPRAWDGRVPHRRKS
jgi:Protein of unknown function (DUF1175)